LREKQVLEKYGGGEGWLKDYAIPMIPNLLTSDLLGATGIFQGL